MIKTKIKRLAVGLFLFGNVILTSSIMAMQQDDELAQRTNRAITAQQTRNLNLNHINQQITNESNWLNSHFGPINSNGPCQSIFCQQPQPGLCQGPMHSQNLSSLKNQMGPLQNEIQRYAPDISYLIEKEKSLKEAYYFIQSHPYTPENCGSALCKPGPCQLSSNKKKVESLKMNITTRLRELNY
jgi:hypothetical protein